MMRVVLLLFAAATVVGACATATTWRNVLRPAGQVEFDRDVYECRRENTHVAETFQGQLTRAVDEDMAERCLGARGWRRVK